MVLEATVICVDNSEWMRNGDFPPSRMEAQRDAVNLLCGAKTQANPESAVALLTCAGKSPEVLVALSSDLGKMLSSLHGCKIAGKLDFINGLQVAQLVLKHRQNKNQHQRVIVFVGSPIAADKDELVRLAKRLKKNNIAVDIVNFGEEAQNAEKLESFISAVNSNDNSHLVTIPPGPHILSDILISSPILTGSSEDGSSGSGSTGSGGGGFGGVDPNLDPELALALKMSLEEERARQEAETKRTTESSAPSASQSVPSSSSTSSTVFSTPASVGLTTPEVSMTDASSEDEEALLAEAIAMSMHHVPTTPVTTTTPSTTTTSTTTVPEVTMDDMSEDQEMLLAMQMSMQASQQSEDVNKLMEDPQFVSSVLMSLPGVDPNDERVKGILENIKGSEKEPPKK